MFLPDLQPTFTDPFGKVDTSLIDLLSDLGRGREERGVGLGWVGSEENGGHECLRDRGQMQV